MLRRAEVRTEFRARVRASLRQEDGGATTFGMMVLCLTGLLVGLAIDVTNLYRNETLLRLTADAASHAGAVALARGDDPLDAARAMIERNMPADRYGLLTDATDLQVLHLDPTTDRLADPKPDGAEANAVVVRLQRSAGVNNLLPTFVLSLVGIDGWSVEVRSVAAVLPTRRCGNAEGLFARGQIVLGSGATLGNGLCLHGQQGVDTSVEVQLGEDLRISLPNPSACDGACANMAPGTVAALNLIMPQTAAHVARLADGFARPDVTLHEETAFFATRPFLGDTEALAEVGLAVNRLHTGQVIEVPPFFFGAMRERPAGLVYLVTCERSLPGTLPGPEAKISLLGIEGQPTLKDAALVTNCPIEMDALSRIEGSLVIQREVDPEAEMLRAAPGASMGDPEGTCDARLRTMLMVPGNLVLPAGLSASNLAVVAGGDVTLAPDPAGHLARHLGLAVHAGGRITTMGTQDLAPCPAATDAVLPSLRVITHAMPPLGEWLRPMARPAPDADMPGERVKARAMGS